MWEVRTGVSEFFNAGFFVLLYNADKEVFICGGREEDWQMGSVAFPLSLETIGWLKGVAREGAADSSVLERLSAWETGSRKPTLKQVEEISKKLHVPFGYLFLKRKPAENFKVLEFRTLDSVEHTGVTPELRDTLAQMEAVQDWAGEYRRKEGIGPFGVVGKVGELRDVDSVLEAARGSFEIPVRWYETVRDENQAFSFLREKCEQQGILVMQNGTVGTNTHRKLSLREFRAFALVDDWAPLIFVNAADSMQGRVFSLLHEMIHVLLGEDNVFNANDETVGLVGPVERLCNRVAAEILVPQEDFMEAWSRFGEQGDVLVSVNHVAQKFHCSLTVASRRALDFGYINKDRYMNLVRGFTRQGLKGNGRSGGNFYTTMASRLDRQFVNMLADSVRMGNTTYTEAFRLTGTTNKTFAALVKDVRERGGRE